VVDRLFESDAIVRDISEAGRWDPMRIELNGLFVVDEGIVVREPVRSLVSRAFLGSKRWAR
jgi:hypothetical protein